MHNALYFSPKIQRYKCTTYLKVMMIVKKRKKNIWTKWQLSKCLVFFHFVLFDILQHLGGKAIDKHQSIKQSILERCVNDVFINTWHYLKQSLIVRRYGFEWVLTCNLQVYNYKLAMDGKLMLEIIKTVQHYYKHMKVLIQNGCVVL